MNRWNTEGAVASHRHDLASKKAVRRLECRGGLGTGSHTDVGESRADAELGSDLRHRKPGHHGTDRRDRVLIELDLAVEWPVIYHQLEVPLITGLRGWVGHEKHRGGRLGGRWPDETAGELHIQQLYEHGQLFLTHIVDFRRGEALPFFDANHTAVLGRCGGRAAAASSENTELENRWKASGIATSQSSVLLVNPCPPCVEAAMAWVVRRSLRRALAAQRTAMQAVAFSWACSRRAILALAVAATPRRKHGLRVRDDGKVTVGTENWFSGCPVTSCGMGEKGEFSRRA